MYDLLLFMHFFGISIGAGTGIYLLALKRHAASNLEQAEARTLLPGIAGALSRVGSMGLLLLIVSGLLMAYMLGSGMLNTAFLIKMLLVVLLVVFVLLMNTLAQRVAIGDDMAAANRMKKLAPFGPLLGVLIILTAVLSFH